MSFDKIIFAFVIVLALTLNVGFVVGDLTIIAHHNVYELALALVVSLIATVMKFGDRSQLGSTLLATSLVADVQLIGAAIVWADGHARRRRGDGAGLGDDRLAGDRRPGGQRRVGAAADRRDGEPAAMNTAGARRRAEAPA